MDETKRDPGNDTVFRFWTDGTNCTRKSKPDSRGSWSSTKRLIEQNKLLYFRPLNRKTRSHFNFFVYVHDGKAGALKITPKKKKTLSIVKIVFTT